LLVESFEIECASAVCGCSGVAVKGLVAMKPRVTASFKPGRGAVGKQIGEVFHLVLDVVVNLNGSDRVDDVITVGLGVEAASSQIAPSELSTPIF
jgi:hypothetical protein